MNFKVVPGESYTNLKEEFTKLYLDDVPSKIIQEKLGLTSNRYCKLVDLCKEEGLIEKRNDNRKQGRKKMRKVKP